MLLRYISSNTDSRGGDGSYYVKDSQETNTRLGYPWGTFRKFRSERKKIQMADNCSLFYVSFESLGQPF